MRNAYMCGDIMAQIYDFPTGRKLKKYRRSEALGAFDLPKTWKLDPEAMERRFTLPARVRIVRQCRDKLAAALEAQAVQRRTQKWYYDPNRHTTVSRWLAAETLYLEELEELERQARPKWRSVAEIVEEICGAMMHLREPERVA